MKHLVICDDGAFPELHSHRLAARQDDESRYYPLNYLYTGTVAKRVAGVSSDLVEALGQRSIKLLFPDFRDVAHSAILGRSWHGVVAVGTAKMTVCRARPCPVQKSSQR